MSARLFVLTGGPGSGKTTLIEALQRAGFACTIEAGRSIIQDQVEIGGRALPWGDPVLFAEMMLCWEMRSYRSAQGHAGPVFLDRGVPDVVGYLRLIGAPVPAHMQKAAATFRYEPRVFIMPPWPQIFTQDSERKQTLQEAERTYDAMVETYTSLGYTLITVPRLPVDDRVRFIIDAAGIGDAGRQRGA